MRQIDDGDGDDRVEQARPRGSATMTMRQQQARHRQDHVHHAHDDGRSTKPRTKPATSPRTTPTTSDGDHHREADEQREPRAVDEAREHVAAELVGAEQEASLPPSCPGRRHADEVAKLLDRRIGRDEIGEDRAEDEHAEDDEPGDRRPVLAMKSARTTRADSAAPQRALRRGRHGSRHRACRMRGLRTP